MLCYQWAAQTSTIEIFDLDDGTREKLIIDSEVMQTLLENHITTSGESTETLSESINLPFLSLFSALIFLLTIISIRKKN
ncbi:MAG: hypothetical protein HeimC2_33200 [Candidatus Heimdallarchaeota archaeon LC_2]|nr:MAG: hypothetical protein HeimC2_35050 [Candidatus Heimdallarchaeota archaeon LC_2]OLS21488.1 MAG: hypothetical protein HeimC2_33200 [Candidatus Heimdallarchaeota archaeon LC_2]